RTTPPPTYQASRLPRMSRRPCEAPARPVRAGTRPARDRPATTCLSRPAAFCEANGFLSCTCGPLLPRSPPGPRSHEAEDLAARRPDRSHLRRDHRSRRTRTVPEGLNPVALSRVLSLALV